MNFDLNIDNYKKDELIKIFDLSQNYNKSILEAKERIIKENINNNKEITKEIKIKTINFITQAKIILLNDNNSNNNNNENNNNETKDFQETVKELYNLSYDLKPVSLEDPSQHMVQIHNKSPYLSSHPSEYFPGVFNPLKKKVLKKNLNIDTRFRNNYYSSSSTNFNVTLPLLINNVLSMQLSAIEMPTTYYNISKQFGNNFFSIKIDEDSQVITIPDGNYDYTGIVNSINNALSVLGGNFQNIVFLMNINNTSNNNGSGQMMVGINSSVTAFEFELNFQADRFGIDDRNTPLPLKLGWVLGFRNGIYTNNTNYVSEGIVDILGPRYLFLVVDDYNNNVNNGFYSAFNSSILNKNILARISLNASPFGLFNENNYNVVTTPRDYFGPVNLQNLNVQLLDEYGRILELNNMDYSFCLTLTVVYDI
jgi:hypothetical protein